MSGNDVRQLLGVVGIMVSVYLLAWAVIMAIKYLLERRSHNGNHN